MRLRWVSVGWREPVEVRIEEEKDDHAGGHEIHVDQENDAGVVETPAALEAAGGIGDAEDGKDHREDEQRRGAVVGEVGEQYGGGEGPEDKQASANEGMTAEVEEISADKVVVWLRELRGRGFAVLPKRWIVERTIAWLNRCRRLAKDWENLNRKALAFLRLASIRLMLRKLCNPA